MQQIDWSVSKAVEFQICQCSPQAMTKIEACNVGTGGTEPMRGKMRFPYCLLKIGQCFTVPFSAGISRGTLEGGWRNYGERVGKKFAVIKHTELGLYEVARVE